MGFHPSGTGEPPNGPKPKAAPIDWVLLGANPHCYLIRHLVRHRVVMAAQVDYAEAMTQERRGLRLPFDARAEVAPEGSPAKMVVARVTDLSLNGCFIQTSSPFPLNALIVVKIFHEGAYFEGKARVVHVQAASGMGVSFRELKPHYQSVLQKWILVAMRTQVPLD